MSRMQQEHGRSAEVVATIHRLFAEPLPAGDEPFPWYCPPGALADCNALLDISDDGEFMDAVAWQVNGHELTGRKRRRWLKRLQRTSRTSTIVAMRYKSSGRRHAVRIPGIWLALLFDPPGRSVLGPWFAGRLLDATRRRLVAWRHRRFIKKQTKTTDGTPEKRSQALPWNQAS